MNDALLQEFKEYVRAQTGAEADPAALRKALTSCHGGNGRVEKGKVQQARLLREIDDRMEHDTRDFYRNREESERRFGGRLLPPQWVDVDRLPHGLPVTDDVNQLVTEGKIEFHPGARHAVRRRGLPPGYYDPPNIPGSKGLQSGDGLAVASAHEVNGNVDGVCKSLDWKEGGESRYVAVHSLPPDKYGERDPLRFELYRTSRTGKWFLYEQGFGRIAEGSSLTQLKAEAERYAQRREREKGSNGHVEKAAGLVTASDQGTDGRNGAHHPVIEANGARLNGDLDKGSLPWRRLNAGLYEARGLESNYQCVLLEGKDKSWRLRIDGEVKETGERLEEVKRYAEIREKGLDRQGGEEPTVSKDDLEAADFITLPQDVFGTNCSNCTFNKEGVCGFKGKLNGEPVDLRGQRVNAANCCAAWNNPGVLRTWKEKGWRGWAHPGLRFKSVVKGSYFEDCKRDDEGHCKPKEGGGESASKDRYRPEGMEPDRIAKAEEMEAEEAAAAKELGLPTTYSGKDDRFGAKGFHLAVDNPLPLASGITYAEVRDLPKTNPVFWNRPAETEEFSIDSLKSCQDYIQPTAVKIKLEGRGLSRRPLIAKVKGEYVILDGNHQVIADKLGGKTKVEARYLGEFSPSDPSTAEKVLGVQTKESKSPLDIVREHLAQVPPEELEGVEVWWRKPAHDGKHHDVYIEAGPEAESNVRLELSQKLGDEARIRWGDGSGKRPGEGWKLLTPPRKEKALGFLTAQERYDLNAIRREMQLFVEKTAGPHEFASTQFDLKDAAYDEEHGDPVPKLEAFAKAIADGDLAADGRETEYHITCVYGLDPETDPKQVQEQVAGFGPVEVTLGEVSRFPATEDHDYDVVKVDVTGDDLTRIHDLIGEMPHQDTHPEFNPHITLAFVKSGKGEQWTGAPWGGEGTVLSFDALTFSTPDGGKSRIELTGVGKKVVRKGLTESQQRVLNWLKANYHSIPTQRRDIEPDTGMYEALGPSAVRYDTGQNAVTLDSLKRLGYINFGYTSFRGGIVYNLKLTGKAAGGEVRKEVQESLPPRPSDPIKVHLPNLQQGYDFSCGAELLLMVATYAGVGPEDEDSMIEFLGSDPETGTPPEAMIAGARKLGLETRAEEGMTLQDLERLTDEGVAVACPIQAYSMNCVLPGQLFQGGVVGASKARYSGDVVEIRTRSGASLSVTLNHPVLTEKGFASAGCLKEGERLLCYLGKTKASATVDYIQHAPSPVEQVFDSFQSLAGPAFVDYAPRPRPFEFHGDAKWFQGKIQVVGTYCKLRDRVIADGTERFSESGFVGTYSEEPSLTGSRRPDKFIGVGSTLGKRDPSRFGSSGLLSGIELCPDHCGGFRSGPLFDPMLLERSTDSRTGDIHAAGQSLTSLPGQVSPHDLQFGFSVQDCNPGADNFHQPPTFSRGPYPDVNFSQCSFDGRCRDSVLAAKLLERGPDDVFLDEIVEVRRFHYDGPVYDFESPNGWYLINNLFISNCTGKGTEKQECEVAAEREEEDGWENGHWVAVIGWDALNVYVADPVLKGARGKLPRPEFLRRWHDVSGSGKKYVRYGIAFWRPERAERVKGLLPNGIKEVLPPTKHLNLTVRVVDGETVRNISPETGDFAGWAIHDDFDFIPEHEVWLDSTVEPAERNFFLHAAYHQQALLDNGKSSEEAYSEAVALERSERAKAKGSVTAAQHPEGKIDARCLYEKWKVIRDGEEEIQVWKVRADAVRDYVDSTFVEGGNGAAYTWCPNDWILIDKDLDAAEWPAVLLHEKVERWLMLNKGLDYGSAHKIAAETEWRWRKENLAPGAQEKGFNSLKDAAQELGRIRDDRHAHDADFDKLKARVDAVGQWVASQKKRTPLGDKILTEAHLLRDKLSGGSGQGGQHVQIVPEKEEKEMSGSYFEKCARDAAGDPVITKAVPKPKFKVGDQVQNTYGGSGMPTWVPGKVVEVSTVKNPRGRADAFGNRTPSSTEFRYRVDFGRANGWLDEDTLESI